MKRNKLVILCALGLIVYISSDKSIWSKYILMLSGIMLLISTVIKMLEMKKEKE